MSERAHDLSGWSLFTLICVAILVMSDGIVLIVPGVIEATVAVIRVAECTSFVLLLAALLAPTLAARLPNGFTRALMRERRGLGLSFALSLLVNLTAIAAFAMARPDLAAGFVLALFERIATTGALFVVALSLLGAALVRLLGMSVQADKHRQVRMRAHQRIPLQSQ